MKVTSLSFENVNTDRHQSDRHQSDKCKYIDYEKEI